MSEISGAQFNKDGNTLAELMTASNAGEAHVVYRDTETGDVAGVLVLAQGDKAGDVLAALQDLLDGPWAAEGGVTIDMSEVNIGPCSCAEAGAMCVEGECVPE